MASSIKGITIEIDGNTKGLTESLKGVNKSISSVNSELRQVDRLLKVDPSSVELAEQKSKLLSEAIKGTSEKLIELKKAKEQADDQLEKGEISEEQFRALTREIIKTESALSKYEKQIKSSENGTDKLDDETKNLKTTQKQTAKQTSVFGDVLKANLTSTAIIGGVKAISSAISGIGSAMLGSIESTKEYRNDLAKLEQNASSSGKSFDNMKEKLSYLNAITGETDSSIEALSNLMQTDISEDGMAEVLDSLSGAVIAFPDTLKIEGLADGLQETLATGKAIGPFSELLERSGIALDDFDGELAKATTSAEKQAVVLKYLEKTGLSKVNEEYKETNKSMIEASETQFAYNDVMSTFAGTLEELTNGIKAEVLPIFTDLMGVITGMMDGSTSVEEGAETIIEIIRGLADRILEAMPMILNTGMTLLRSLLQGIVSALPLIIPVVVDIVLQLVKTLIELLPQILEAGVILLVELAKGITEAIPELIPVLIDVVMNMVNYILENIDMIIDTGIDLILALVDGIVEAMPILIEKMPVIIGKLAWALIKALPKIISAGGQLLVKYLVGIVKSQIAFFKGIGELIGDIIGKFTDMDLFETGKDLIKGLWNGIKNMGQWIKDKISGFTDDILNGIKGFFGIHSPSTVMRDEVGVNLGLGMAEGIDNSLGAVKSAMGNLSSEVEASINPVINPTANSNPLILNIENFNNTRSQNVEAFMEEAEFMRKNSSLAKGGS